MTQASRTYQFPTLFNHPVILQQHFPVPGGNHVYFYTRKELTRRQADAMMMLLQIQIDCGVYDSEPRKAVASDFGFPNSVPRRQEPQK